LGKRRNSLLAGEYRFVNSALIVPLVFDQTTTLGRHPEIGRRVEEPEFREWVIEFGHGAYVVLYHRMENRS